MDSNPNPNYSRHFDFYISEGVGGGLTSSIHHNFSYLCTLEGQVFGSEPS